MMVYSKSDSGFVAVTVEGELCVLETAADDVDLLEEPAEETC